MRAGRHALILGLLRFRPIYYFISTSARPAGAAAELHERDTSGVTDFSAVLTGADIWSDAARGAALS